MRTERGLTLLELLVVLTILGLVSGMAASAFGEREARQQARWANELSTLLRAARQEAIGSGQLVYVRMGENDVSAQPSRHLLVLRMSSAVRLHWVSRSLGGQRTAPMFYPDGSAAPGMLEVSSEAGSRRIEIDWLGGVHDVDARP